MQQNQLPLNDYNHNFLIILTRSNNLPIPECFHSTFHTTRRFLSWMVVLLQIYMYKDKNSFTLHLYETNISLRTLCRVCENILYKI